MTDAPSPAYAGPQRVLSGIQASGALHLGNYLGALKRFTALQDVAVLREALAELGIDISALDDIVDTGLTLRRLS